MTEDNRREYQDILSSLVSFHEFNNIDEMDKPFNDSFTTEQQRRRDEHVTSLLEKYVDGYSRKIKSNSIYKNILVYGCSAILFIFTVVFIILLFICLLSEKKENNYETVIELVSVCVTFLTLIMGILNIIAKYVFPEDDEKYISNIVELIQNNDLKNKQENIRAYRNEPIFADESEELEE